MGLGPLYGAAGIQDQARERIMQRLAMQQAQQQMDLALRGSNRADQQLQAQIEANALQRQANEEQRTYTRGKDDEAAGIRLGELVPAGELSPTASPVAVGQLRKAGMLDDTKARPAVAEGPLLPGDTGRAIGPTKLPSAIQTDRAANNTRMEQAAAALKSDREADNARLTKAEADRVRDRAEDNQRALAMLEIMRNNSGSIIEKRGLESQILELKARVAEDTRKTARLGLETTKTLLNRMKTHPGLSASTGFYEMRSGLTPDSAAFNQLASQVANSLTLENLAKLKGSTSDADREFIKNITSRLDNKRVATADYEQAILDAEKFIDETLKITADAPPPGAPGATPDDPLGLGLPPKKK